MSVVKFPKVFSREEIMIIAASVFAGTAMEGHWTYKQHGRERPSPDEDVQLYLDFISAVDQHVIRIEMTDEEAGQRLLAA